MKFFAVNPSSIQRVTLGCRAPDVLKEQVRAALATDYPESRLEQMRVDSTRYVLIPEEI
jgi:hypothetical protein